MVYNDRLGWIKRADREFESLGAPPVNYVRAEFYWEDAAERLVELVLDEYGDEFSEDTLLARVTPYDVALTALALAAQERSGGEDWYEVALGAFLTRYARRIARVRDQRTLPNTSLSIWPSDYHSDADPGL